MPERNRNLNITRGQFDRLYHEVAKSLGFDLDVWKTDENGFVLYDDEMSDECKKITELFWDLYSTKIKEDYFKPKPKPEVEGLFITHAIWDNWNKTAVSRRAFYDAVKRVKENWKEVHGDDISTKNAIYFLSSMHFQKEFGKTGYIPLPVKFRKLLMDKCKTWGTVRIDFTHGIVPQEHTSAIAIVHPRDNFCYEIGSKIVTGRIKRQLGLSGKELLETGVILYKPSYNVDKVRWIHTLA